MADLVPESEREKHYDRWYELSKLYHDAIRHDADAKEIAATKAIADDAWLAYVDIVTNNLTGRFDGYEYPQGPR